MSGFTKLPCDEHDDELDATHNVNDHGHSHNPNHNDHIRTGSQTSRNDAPSRWRHVRCCALFRSRKIAKSLLSDANRNCAQSTKRKAEEALVIEQCLDASVSTLVERSSWVNATILALTLKTTFWIDFPSKSSEVTRCQNAWIYLLIIFLLCIMALVFPLCCCEPTEALRAELERKQEKDDLRDSGSTAPQTQNGEVVKPQCHGVNVSFETSHFCVFQLVLTVCSETRVITKSFDEGQEAEVGGASVPADWTGGQCAGSQFQDLDL